VVEEEEGEQQQQGAPPRRPPLAVEALRDKIVEKVKANRVTLIVGDTGCDSRICCCLTGISIAPMQNGGVLSKIRFSCKHR
jgi:hypothetical protein